MIPIHNGIDTDSFSYNYQLRTAVRAELEAEESQSVILAVGRLTPAKDYHNLLNGFASVVALRPDTVLWIAGVGPLEPELRELGANLGIHKKVRFLGLRKDVHALMSAADVFVLSSAWEGFGLVVAEAMACERTVVATDCGGVREVLGENGWLVPPRSSEELAEALNAALSQDQSRQVFIGQNARTRIKELYSIAAASERWARLYTRKPLTF
jgi:glycosyltransferase involved in cell wall biosynthesis